MRFTGVVGFSTALAATLGLPAMAFGAVLYGVDSATDSLAIIDPVTGATTIVGTGLDPFQTATDNRFATPIALGVRPSDQTLFAYNNSEIVGGVTTLTGDLVSINAITGVGTIVGAPSGQDLAALAFSPGGQLYGLRSQLFQINDVTGVQSLVNTITHGATILEVLGADFDSSGTLYAAAADVNTHANPSLYIINPATGDATLVGPLAFPGFLGSIAFSPTGQLIGTDINGNLYDIDALTGALSNLRVLTPINAGDQGLGFVNAVPEPSTFALAGLALAGLLLRRRS